MDKTSSQSAKKLTIEISIIASLAGLLFGFDTGIVNGALKFLQIDLNLNIEQLEKITSILSIGALIGALASASITRTIGRKMALIISAGSFTIFATLLSLAPNYETILFSRFALGLTVGLSSFAAPLYLSEISPHKIRGRLISIYQLMIVLGIFIIFLSNALLSKTGSWRLMFSVLIIPSVLMLIGSFFIPKSPRWLMLIGDEKEARKTLEKIRGNKKSINFDFNEMKKSLKYKKEKTLKLLTNKYFLKILLLGVLLQLLQQFCGANALGYYSTSIFTSANINNPYIATVIMGAIKVISTIVAIIYVDKIGRKPILYLGLIISGIAASLIGLMFFLEPNTEQAKEYIGIVIFVSTLLFQIGYSISLGPIVWMICVEIFPLMGRDFAITITTATNWLGNAIISRYSLSLIDAIGDANTFWIFGGFCFLGLILVYGFTPETKNVPLEEIEMNLKDGIKLKDLGKKRLEKPS